MTYAVSDDLFVDELQDAVFGGGISPEEIAIEAEVDFTEVDDWLKGTNLPPRETQTKVLEFLETNLV